MRDIILAFFGSLLPALLINVKKERLFWVGLSGSVGWMAYTLMLTYSDEIIVSTFIGALAVGLYSEAMARKLKTPAIVFSVSGIFPLVPGTGAYLTAQYIVENELYNAAAKGVETIASASCIALGIMFMSAAFKFFNKVWKSILYNFTKS